MTSIAIVGSASRRLTSAIHCAAVIPGSTRQSIVASATDGMTLTFGGSPTPDRRLVSEIVECWIALLNLFLAKVPTRDFIVSSTLKEDRGGGSQSSRANARTSRSFGF